MNRFIRKPINAPIPAILADAGFGPFQAKYRIRPTRGIRKPKIPQPMLPESAGSGIFSWGTPQCGQITAAS